MTGNNRYVCLHDRVYPAHRVVARYRPVSIRFPPDAAHSIESIWKERERSGARLYNGKLFRFDRIVDEEDGLVLYVSNTDYKEFVGTRDKRFRKQFPQDELRSIPTAVGAIIVGSDEKVLIGRRTGDLELYPGMFSFVAGWMDRDLDLPRETIDPSAALIREITEETGIESGEIASMAYLGTAKDLLMDSVYLTYDVRLKIGVSEVVAHIPHEREFLEYLQVEHSAKHMRDFLRVNRMRLTPMSVFSLELFLRTIDP